MAHLYQQPPAYPYYNQYYNYQPNRMNLEDSSYYSRNNSMINYQDMSLNDSLKMQHKSNPISFGHAVSNVSLPYAKPAVKASTLKFSIDSILGTNSAANESESLGEAVLSDECVKASSKKRKSRASNTTKSGNVSSSDSKRIRTIFTQEQLDKLEVEFNRQQYMVGSERSYLASSLNLSESQVKIWFQNRRIKWRKTSAPNQNGSGKFGADDDLNDQSYSNDSEYDD